MKQARWYILLGLSLVLVSVTVYLLQVYAFHKADDTLFYLMQDLAFVPVQVLLVMLIIDRLLRRKEKESLLNKLNMIIGVFFNEVGTGLIEYFIRLEDNISEIKGKMQVNMTWNKKKFEACVKYHLTKPYNISMDMTILREMKDFLLSRRDELLRMLENPNLLEHDQFTDLLWAVFHLADELHHRETLDNLPDSDRDHLRGDIGRAYTLLIVQWLSYMEHLKIDYPYLFSLAVRTNPFSDRDDVFVYE